MPTNLEYRERESRARGQQAQRRRKRARAREKKTKETFFCWRNNMKFCSSGEKMRNASGNQGEKSDSENKKEKEHVQHLIPP